MAVETISDNAEISFIRDAIDRSAVSSTQILVIGISLVLNMLDGFDITAMAFTAHSIGEQMKIAPDQLGIVFSAALAGMMLGAMFVAPLSDVIGRRNILLICVAGIGISMCATAFANSLWPLVILRSITGLGVGGMLASLAAITFEYTPEKYRGLSVVCITAGYPLGATLGGFVAAPLIANYGWESGFFLGGLATLSMLLAASIWKHRGNRPLSTARCLEPLRAGYAAGGRPSALSRKAVIHLRPAR